MSTRHAVEVSSGERFKFGANWRHFLAGLTEEKISAAIDNVRTTLGRENLEGLTFLDVGSGSGLTSLAAFRLGARVVSFDYDPQSVACTKRLHAQYSDSNTNWTVTEGSVLDKQFLGELGKFDIACSWGVLHHTGAMWRALENMIPLVNDNGRLYIAIYNDQGPWSRRWLAIKRTYNKLPRPAAAIFAALIMGGREIRFILGALARFQPNAYISRWTNYGGKDSRGMSLYYDLIDWVGGYPFEVAKPEQIFCFYRNRGFVLDNLRTCGGGLGCNVYVFSRTAVGTSQSV